MNVWGAPGINVCYMCGQNHLQESPNMNLVSKKVSGLAQTHIEANGGLWQRKGADPKELASFQERMINLAMSNMAAQLEKVAEDRKKLQKYFLQEIENLDGTDLERSTKAGKLLISLVQSPLAGFPDHWRPAMDEFMRKIEILDYPFHDCELTVEDRLLLRFNEMADLCKVFPLRPDQLQKLLEYLVSSPLKDVPFGTGYCALSLFHIEGSDNEVLLGVVRKYVKEKDGYAQLKALVDSK